MMMTMKNMGVQALDILAQEVQVVPMRRETVEAMAILEKIAVMTRETLERAIVVIKARVAIMMTKTMIKANPVVMAEQRLVAKMIVEKVRALMVQKVKGTVVTKGTLEMIITEKVMEKVMETAKGKSNTQTFFV